MTQEYVARVEIPDEWKEFVEALSGTAKLPDQIDPLAESIEITFTADDLYDLAEQVAEVNESLGSLGATHQTISRPTPKE